MVIPHPCINVHVNNKGQKFKSDTTKIEKSEFAIELVEM
jgi:hypothetical protein